MAVLLAPLMATACTTRSELGFATLMNEVPATQAIIVPPPGGPAIVAVLQRKYQNGVSQEIALSTASLTPGQNAFHVTLASGSVPQSEIDDVLSLPSMTEDRLQREMEERLPGIEMQTSLVYVQNKYGPFGFATGRSAGGDVCLYAWQRIEPNEPAVLVPGGVISVRLRLCDVAATPEQLLRTMYGFTVSAYYMSGAWNPYGAPPRVPEHLGQIDAPIYPLGMNGAPQTVIRERRIRVPTSPSAAGPVIDKDTVLPSAPAQPSISVPEEPAASPQTGYPVVPPPPSQ
ncbi:cellulose biosynthesis protein BcsN [Microvirga pakistanensis]|uniref:cellulose biosynthesis protein BcsN n=1 Tax=Microvirga pakistanensis TaxID=1682650 RepID=UPI00141AF8F3|nr:cellulose biosynthesis protein BcsN [Microvirga pakistanensis]